MDRITVNTERPYDVVVGAGVAGVLAQWGPWPHVLPYLINIAVAVVAANLIVLVPEKGLEPSRIAPPDPKSGASTSFATLAGCPDRAGR